MRQLTGSGGPFPRPSPHVWLKVFRHVPWYSKGSFDLPGHPLHFAGKMRPAYRAREPACLLASIAVIRLRSSWAGQILRPLFSRWLWKSPARMSRARARSKNGRPKPSRQRNSTVLQFTVCKTYLPTAPNDWPLRVRACVQLDVPGFTETVPCPAKKSRARTESNLRP